MNPSNTAENHNTKNQVIGSELNNVSEEKIERDYRQATKFNIMQGAMGGAFMGAFISLIPIMILTGPFSAVAAPAIVGIALGIIALGSAAGAAAGYMQREEGLGKVKLSYSTTRSIAGNQSAYGLGAVGNGIAMTKPVNQLPNYSNSYMGKPFAGNINNSHLLQNTIVR